MATCEAERRNKQAVHALRAGMGGWVLDVGNVLQILEGSDRCTPDCNEESK